MGGDQHRIAVLEAICRNWPVGRVRVADRGVREGILYGLMRGQGPLRRSWGRRVPHTH